MIAGQEPAAVVSGATTDEQSIATKADPAHGEGQQPSAPAALPPTPTPPPVRMTLPLSERAAPEAASFFEGMAAAPLERN